MKNRERISHSDRSFEKQVFEALKYYGYKVPKSQEEIEQYVRMFGNTKVELPDSLKDAGALFDNALEKETSFNGDDQIKGMAARGDNEEKLPDYIVEKIKKDFKNGKWLK